MVNGICMGRIVNELNIYTWWKARALLCPERGVFVYLGISLARTSRSYVHGLCVTRYFDSYMECGAFKPGVFPCVHDFIRMAFHSLLTELSIKELKNSP